MKGFYKKSFRIAWVMLILSIGMACIVAGAVQSTDQAVSSLNDQLVQLVRSISLVPLDSQVSVLVTAMNPTTGVIASATALNSAYQASGSTGSHSNANMLLGNFLQAVDMVIKHLTKRFLAPVAPDTIQAAYSAATAMVPGVSPAATTIQFLVDTLSVANNALAGNTVAIQAAKQYYSAEAYHPDAVALQTGFLQIADTLVKRLTQRLKNPVAPDTVQAALLTAANDPVLGVGPLIATLQSANAAVSNFVSRTNNMPNVSQKARQIITTLYSPQVEHPDAVDLRVAFLQSAFGLVTRMTEQLNNPVPPMTLQSACAIANDATTGAQVMVQILQTANNALTGNVLALSKATAWYRAEAPHSAATSLNNALTSAQAALTDQMDTQVTPSASATSPSPVVSASVPVTAQVAPATPAASSAPTNETIALVDALRTADQVVVNLTNQLSKATDRASQQRALSAANDPVTGATPAIAALQAANNALTGNQAAIALAGGLYNAGEAHPDVAALTGAMIAVATAIQQSR